ncbi:uncharacterized protein At5g41620-like isoform X2 [Arachis duranensis]|uniref:Uncharacterized protein At5g41620-like isoform X2 n=1 Tax=Arachis duranensis TaxID=130453 RepID=A0A9C6TLR5_ARADU|nr:uncharacterized protein At5g41620-like isoform X2 [Arachis duranensis]
MLLASCTVKYFKTKLVEREMERGREEKREEGIMVFVDKRGGSSTPPPLWRLHLPSHHSRINIREFLNCPTSSSLSARELCAQLWETQPYHMALLPRCRRKLPKHFADPPDTPYHQVAPYNISVNPTSSAELRGKCGDPKTSRELLKVLSRISSLEEQNASSMSVIKALKMELDLSQVQVRDLLQEKRMILRQIEEDKLVRKNKEHEKVKATVQSMNEEIEEERRLRQHSESVGRKLTRELSEMKSSLSSCFRDLEREQKGRILLENLCDDFAKGIRDYEREARSLRQSNGSETGQVKGENNLDRLMLHISEAWLDERRHSGGRDSVVDKLGVDIETFLHAKRSVDSGRCSSHIPCLHSLDNAAMRKQVQSEECELATQAQKHVGSSSISSEGDKVYPETDNIFGEGSVVKLSDMSESCSSSKLPKGVNDNSLMAKLLQARLHPHKPSM